MYSSKADTNASFCYTSEDEFDQYLEKIRLSCRSAKKTKSVPLSKGHEKEISQSCKILKQRNSPDNVFSRPALTDFKRKTTPSFSLRSECDSPRIRWQDLFRSSSSDSSEDEDERKSEKELKCENDEEVMNKKDVCSVSHRETFKLFEGFRDRDDANDFLGSLTSESSSVDDAKRHPRAIGPVRCFKMYRTSLVEDLTYIFNKFVFGNKLPSDLNISWNGRMTSTAGFCKCKKNSVSGVRSCSIELSPKLLTTADRVRDTLVHELCHAATWIVSEERDSHGPFWRAWARGANLMFSSLPAITVCHKYKKI